MRGRERTGPPENQACMMNVLRVFDWIARADSITVTLAGLFRWNICVMTRPNTSNRVSNVPEKFLSF